MALPYVKINFANGAIGGAEAMDDGVTLMLLSDYGGSADLQCQNIEDYRRQVGDPDDEQPEIAAFYAEAGGNARLIISNCQHTETALKAKLAEYSGEIRIIVLPEASSLQAIATLQAVADWSANTLYAPAMFLISLGSSVALPSGASSWRAQDKARVAIVDSVEDDSETPLLFYVAGRLATIPVQRSLARARDGALFPQKLYTPDGDPIDNIYAETQHAKGLITARTFAGKAGYYISDDPLCVPESGDYAFITRRRTIDKAYRIAYATLVNYVGDEIPVTASGKIPPATCAEIQHAVERAIVLSMASYGNLGTDPGNGSDSGVSCYVDPSQDVVSTSSLNVTLSVRPYGYAKYITVDLGFSIDA